MKYIDDTLEGKTVLITGGAGFIGSNIAHYLQRHHECHIIIFDKFRETALSEYSLSLGHFKNLIGFKGTVLAGDINSNQDLAILQNLPIDYIFHQAAISDTTCFNEEIVMRTNTNAFYNILNLAQQKKAHVIYASSAGVYGNSPAPNSIKEGECPENIYGFSKLSMDRIALRFALENPELRVIGLRYFNVYGERELYKGKTASMILQLALQALQDSKVRLFKEGQQKRDFVYIEDVIQANIKAIKAKQSGLYNVGYGVARSYNEIINILKETLNIKFKVKYIDNPYKFFQEHTCADISSTQMDLNYKPNFNLERGIKAYCKTIKKISKEIGIYD